jgi:hypothetical protein
VFLNVQALTITMTQKVRSAIETYQAGVPREGATWDDVVAYNKACQVLAAVLVEKISTKPFEE